MAGTLYLVGTPIGNLADLSPRAIETLKTVDFIAAEDTRVTLKLLNHFEIKKPLVSYYEHNRAESGERIIARLIAGETCALVTDAGMPAISDPGEDMVRLCAENGVDVRVVPGPSALVSALALSALSTGRFTFEGFLAVDKNARFEHLDSLRGEKRTMIFYEAPHKLLATLRDMLEVLGDRRVTLCRELTKIYEETYRTTLSAAIEYYGENAPKGEFVLVLEGASDKGSAVTAEEAIKMALELRSSGMSNKDAAKRASQRTGVSRNVIYDGLLDLS